MFMCLGTLMSLVVGTVRCRRHFLLQKSSEGNPTLPVPRESMDC